MKGQMLSSHGRSMLATMRSNVPPHLAVPGPRLARRQASLTVGMSSARRAVPPPACIACDAAEMARLLTANQSNNGRLAVPYRLDNATAATAQTREHGITAAIRSLAPRTPLT